MPPALGGGMTNQITNTRVLPHHRLVAYQVAKELVGAVMQARIRDAQLRDQAMRAVSSAALNIAEGAGKQAGKARRHSFDVARGEAIEAVAAVEIAAECGLANAESVPRCLAIADRLVALLIGLTR